MHRAFSWLMFALALTVAAYAVVAYTMWPPGVFVHPSMRLSFEQHRFSLYAHVFASALALALGSAQFNARWRAKHPALHRAVGRVYLGLGVLPGGLAGLMLSTQAAGGSVGRLGFGVLALVWLFTGAMAYRSIRAGEVQAHRRWMVRNFALTFAAATLRLWLAVLMLAGLTFPVAYPIVAWLCWVPNLLLAEQAFNRRVER